MSKEAIVVGATGNLFIVARDNYIVTMVLFWVHPDCARGPFGYVGVDAIFQAPAIDAIEAFTL